MSVFVTLLSACGGRSEGAAVKAAAPAAPVAEPAHHGHDGHHDHHGHSQPGHGPLGHRFEDAEHWAKEFDNPARDEWQRPSDVVAAMKIAEAMTVADIGAGTGYFLPHLSRAVGPKGKVIALDIEPGMVRYMTQRAARQHLTNVVAKLVPLDDPQLAPGTVDRVLIVNTWHHIERRPAYAKKLLSALTPEGAVFVVDFTQQTHRGPPKEHRVTAERVIEELRAGGFAAEMIDEPLPDQYIVMGKRPPP